MAESKETKNRKQKALQVSKIIKERQSVNHHVRIIKDTRKNKEKYPLNLETEFDNEE